MLISGNKLKVMGVLGLAVMTSGCAIQPGVYSRGYQVPTTVYEPLQGPSTVYIAPRGYNMERNEHERRERMERERREQHERMEQRRDGYRGYWDRNHVWHNY